MCGVVGGVAKRDVVSFLLDGLRRLEYRGYDSAGIAVLNQKADLNRLRTEGKVKLLEDLLEKTPIEGFTGIAHTRWATHGKPSEKNAHPHIVGDRLVIVHNGIIENYDHLKTALGKKAEQLLSETDSEVIALCIYEKLNKGLTLLQAVQQTIPELEGAYALCVMDKETPDCIIGVKSGPPLILGLGKNENFLASDVLALNRIVDEFIYLEDGDVAELSSQNVRLFDKSGKEIQRKVFKRNFKHDAIDKGEFRHFMLKEIFEQPQAVQNTLLGRIAAKGVLEQAFGFEASKLFDNTQGIQIVACGTSFHAGLVGKLWLEGLAGLPCQVEIASEFRYRNRAQTPNSLLVCISQSGETADTLAALRGVGAEEFIGNLTICNVPESSLVRESHSVLMTQAGPEIGVCSTKAFTTQLMALFLLSLVFAKRRGLNPALIEKYIQQLQQLPALLEEILKLAPALEKMARSFAHKTQALFLGRGLHYPIALEGALKLKEISYIHAEAYAAGELKHGPLALVDRNMPVIVTVPDNNLLEKTKSNIQEVKTRGGELFIFADKKAQIESDDNTHCIVMPSMDEILSPIAYTIPLQLLAYYVAVLKGTDIDQPRNLAKSVTVE